MSVPGVDISLMEGYIFKKPPTKSFCLISAMSSCVVIVAST